VDSATGLRVGLEGTTPPRSMRSVMSSSSLPIAGSLQSLSPEVTYTEEARSLGNGSSNNGMGRTWRMRGEEGGIYVQCVAAVYALARDPSPHVASLGRQILRTVGVEVVVKPLLRANSGPGHQRQLSVPAIPPSPLPSGLVRSTSWVASTSGESLLLWP
jgi:regulator-associated protein of mTOR